MWKHIAQMASWFVTPWPEHHVAEGALNEYWLMIVSYGGGGRHRQYISTILATILLSNQDSAQLQNY